MKKSLFIIILVLSFILNVNAATTKNGVNIIDDGSNEFSLYCSYNGGYYALIDRSSTEDNGNVEPDNLPFNEASNETLKKNNFMRDDGSLDCPLYAEVDKNSKTLIGFVNDFDYSETDKSHYTLKIADSSCTGKCNNISTNNGVKITETNDNSVTMYCKYADGTSIRFDKVALDSDDTTVEFYNNVLGNYIPPFFQSASKKNLINNKFLDSSTNKYDCPMYIAYTVEFKNEKYNITGYQGFYNNISDIPTTIGISYSTLTATESECIGKCDGNQISESNEKKYCDYSYNGEALYYEGILDSCTIEYKGKDISVNKNTCAQIYSATNCPDLYYNSNTNNFVVATYDFNNWFNNHNNYDPTMYNFVCGSDPIEYYCDYECEYPGNRNINCVDIGNKIVTGSICNDPNALKSMRFIGYLLFVAKLLIPILLIIFGSIDYGKAVISSDADAVKKATNTFMMRVIAGVAIFFLPTVINFVFKGLLKVDTFTQYNNCRMCIFNPNKCEIQETED